MTRIVGSFAIYSLDQDKYVKQDVDGVISYVTLETDASLYSYEDAVDLSAQNPTLAWFPFVNIHASYGSVVGLSPFDKSAVISLGNNCTFLFQHLVLGKIMFFDIFCVVDNLDIDFPGCRVFYRGGEVTLPLLFNGGAKQHYIAFVQVALNEEGVEQATVNFIASPNGWGGGGGSNPPFSDANPIIYKSSDPTSLVRLVASGISPGVTRQLIALDADYYIAAKNVNTEFSAEQSFYQGLSVDIGKLIRSLDSNNSINLENNNTSKLMQIISAGSIQFYFSSAAREILFDPSTQCISFGFTGSLAVPQGTTLERQHAGGDFSMRGNSDLGLLEYYDGSNWVPIVGSKIIGTILMQNGALFLDQVGGVNQFSLNDGSGVVTLAADTNLNIYTNNTAVYLTSTDVQLIGASNQIFLQASGVVIASNGGGTVYMTLGSGSPERNISNVDFHSNKTLYITNSGSLKSCGRATLVAGSVSISGTSARASVNNCAFANHISFSGTTGVLSCSCAVDGTLIITSSDASDTGLVQWFIVQGTAAV